MFLSRIAAAVLLTTAPLAAFAAEDEIVATNRPKPVSETEAPAAKTEAVTAEATAKNTQAQVLSAVNATRPIERTQPTSWSGYDEDTGPRKREIHGEVGASIGTGGYKSAYVSALIPVGETGTLGIAYSQTDHGKNGYWYADPYDYGPGYGSYAPGYGRYGASYRGDYYGSGYSPYGIGYARGGTSKSLSISLDLSARDKDRDRDEECDTVRYESSPSESIWGGYRPSRRVCTKTTNYPY